MSADMTHDSSTRQAHALVLAGKQLAAPPGPWATTMDRLRHRLPWLGKRVITAPSIAVRQQQSITLFYQASRLYLQCGRFAPSIDALSLAADAADRFGFILLAACLYLEASHVAAATTTAAADLTLLEQKRLLTLAAHAMEKLACTLQTTPPVHEAHTSSPLRLQHSPNHNNHDHHHHHHSGLVRSVSGYFPSAADHPSAGMADAAAVDRAEDTLGFTFSALFAHFAAAMHYPKDIPVAKNASSSAVLHFGHPQSALVHMAVCHALAEVHVRLAAYKEALIFYTWMVDHQEPLGSLQPLGDTPASSSSFAASAAESLKKSACVLLSTADIGYGPLSHLLICSRFQQAHIHVLQGHLDVARHLYEEEVLTLPMFSARWCLAECLAVLCMLGSGAAPADVRQWMTRLCLDEDESKSGDIVDFSLIRGSHSPWVVSLLDAMGEGQNTDWLAAQRPRGGTLPARVFGTISPPLEHDAAAAAAANGLTTPLLLPPPQTLVLAWTQLIERMLTALCHQSNTNDMII